MWGEFNTKKDRLLLLLILSVGFGLRIVISVQPISTLLMKSLTDDAYYYFVLARNTTQLGMISFDGINPTNGFHPLWWIMLLPIFGLPGSVEDLHVHMALILASVLDIIALWAITQVAAKLTKHVALGLVAGLIYALNPMVIFQTANGLETSLGMATLSLFWLIYLQWLISPKSKKLSGLVGMLAGFMILARTDNIFFFGLSLLCGLWYWRDHRAWRNVAKASVIALAIILPWLLWSRIAVGSWLQESGIAVPMAIRVRFTLKHGDKLITTLIESVRQLASPNLWLRGDPTGLPFIIGVILWVALLIGLVSRWKRSMKDLEVAALAPLIGAGVALLVFHAGIRWYPRPWYFVPTAAAFSVGVAIVVKPLLIRRRLLLPAFGLLLYYAIAAAAFWQVGFYPWQQEMRQAASWIKHNLPSASTVGSFNAGIYAFYSERRIVGLDGVVNHTAFEAVKNRNILHYLQASDIDFLVDYDSAVRREYAPFMGDGYPNQLDELAVLGGHKDGPLGLLRVYRVRKIP